MKDKLGIDLDNPRYAGEHVKEIGYGWYALAGLLFLGWVALFIAMLVTQIFSWWPLAFFIGTVAVLYKIGKQLGRNGYLSAEERKEILDAQVKDSKECTCPFH